MTSNSIIAVELLPFCEHFTSAHDVGYSLILLSTLSAFREISTVVEFGLDVLVGNAWSWADFY